MTSGFGPIGEKQAREAQERQRAERDAEAADIVWIMGSKQGRRVVRRLLSQARVFQSVFDTNAMAMAFAEGRRNQGLKLLDLVNTHCPQLYPVMMREADERNTTGRGRTKPS